MTSTTMNGSSRAPKRDLVRRTPLATALTLPCWRVRSVTMRSASPSFWVRRTIAASRYRAMGSLSYAIGQTPVCRAADVTLTGGPGAQDHAGSSGEAVEDTQRSRRRPVLLVEG